jgi:plasmid stabilization system protein ParE
MAYRIRYLPKAVAQLDAILEHITAHNPAGARRVIAAVKHSIDLLAAFPHSAKESEIPGIREMPIVRYRYIVFYTVDDDAEEVIILRIRHASQDPAHHLD